MFDASCIEQHTYLFYACFKRRVDGSGYVFMAPPLWSSFLARRPRRLGEPLPYDFALAAPVALGGMLLLNGVPIASVAAEVAAEQSCLRAAGASSSNKL